MEVFPPSYWKSFPAKEIELFMDQWMGLVEILKIILATYSIDFETVMLHFCNNDKLLPEQNNKMSAYSQYFNIMC